MDLVKLREELEIDRGCWYKIYNDHLGYPTFNCGVSDIRIRPRTW